MNTFRRANVPVRASTRLTGQRVHGEDVLARRDPIGKHLTLSFTPEKPCEVAGIVADVKQASWTPRRMRHCTRPKRRIHSKSAPTAASTTP